MDLCVPRNVEPKIAQDSRVTLLNIDQINLLLKIRHRRMNHALAEAEQRVASAAHQHAARVSQKPNLKFLF